MSGDERRVARLVVRHYAQVYRYLRFVAGNEDDAKDLTQQTFVNAVGAFDSFRGGSASAWLHRIAHRLFIRFLSERKSISIADDLPAPEGLHEEGIVLLQALEQLSPEHKQAFLLKEVQGFDVKEIADICEVPEGTIKSRLFSARERLRALLSPANEVPEHETGR